MTIDNSSAALRERKLFYILIISMTTALIIILLTDLFYNPVLGINRNIWAIAIIVIYLAVNIYRFMLDYTYIDYNDSGEKIVFKYFTLRPFIGKHKSIEIPKSSFAKYEIQSSILNRKKSIILYQRVNKKLAKYPPISLSGLKKKELTDLLTSLNSIAR